MAQLTERQFTWLALCAIALAAFLAYAPSFHGEFVWDDVSSVLLHEHVKDPSKFLQLFKEDQHAFGRGQGNFYRPLVAATFMLDFALAYDGPIPAPRVPDVSPFIFRVSSTVWHLLAAAFLFALLKRLDAPRFVALAAPLIYALHPLHTEAVAYISGRADSMSAAFMFAGLWCAIGRKQAFGTALCALCFVGGLLSKESTFILPVLLLLFVIGIPKASERVRRPVLPLIVTVAILCGYGVLRMTVLKFGTDTQASTTALGPRMVETLQSFALYLKLLVVPTGLHMERSLLGVPAWTAAVGGALLAALVALTVVLFLRKNYRPAIGIAWFLASWLPISGIFPLNAPMAEHWMYVPMAGLIWAALELLWQAFGKGPLKPVPVVMTYGLCLIFLGLTIARNQDWMSNESLYRATLAKNSNSSRIHYNLAVTYQDLTDNPAGAKRHYKSVVALYEHRKKAAGQEVDAIFWDEELESHMSLGDIYMQERRYQEALQHFLTLLHVAPTEEQAPLIAMAATGAGQCFMAMGQRDAARQAFERAIQLSPALEPQLTGIIQELGPAA